jgi:SpoVK/Ycf46/Vps4 family AAA+-type ATPase
MPITSPSKFIRENHLFLKDSETDFEIIKEHTRVNWGKKS